MNICCATCKNDELVKNLERNGPIEERIWWSAYCKECLKRKPSPHFQKDIVHKEYTYFHWVGEVEVFEKELFEI
jgi:hypothetical protein